MPEENGQEKECDDFACPVSIIGYGVSMILSIDFRCQKYRRIIRRHCDRKRRMRHAYQGPNAGCAIGFCGCYKGASESAGNVGRIQASIASLDVDILAMPNLRRPDMIFMTSFHWRNDMAAFHAHSTIIISPRLMSLMSRAPSRRHFPHCHRCSACTSDRHPVKARDSSVRSAAKDQRHGQIA